MADLQSQPDHTNAGVARFNSIYATHQALVEDLAELEQLNRDTQARLVKVDVRRSRNIPR